MGVRFGIATKDYGEILFRPIIMTTDHSFNGSKVVKDNTLYYLEYKINNDKTYTAYISLGNYFSDGGNVVYSANGTIDDTTWSKLTNGYIFFGVVDNYGGSSASMNIKQLDIY